MLLTLLSLDTYENDWQGFTYIILLTLLILDTYEKD